MTTFTKAPFAVIAISAAILGSLSHPVAGQTYNAATDFSAKNNPTGVWSYGWESSRGTALTLYNESYTDSYGYSLWRTTGIDYPKLWKNATNKPITGPDGSALVPAGKLAFHPGPQGQNSVYRWTAPLAGAVSISGYFIGYDFKYPTTTDVAVNYNSPLPTTIFSGNISSYNKPLFFAMFQTVNTGDTIDFCVGYGSDHSLQGDTTGVEAIIKYITAGLLRVNLNASTVCGGRTAVGQAVLNVPPSNGGAVVKLVSSNPAVAAVPPSVTVPAGATFVPFQIPTASVPTSTPVTITATYANISHTATLTVLPVTLSSLALHPATVEGGSDTDLTIQLNGPAPQNGLTVTFTSNTPSFVTLPSSYTIPSGVTSISFPIYTPLVSTKTTILITGTLLGTSQTATLTLIP